MHKSAALLISWFLVASTSTAQDKFDADACARTVAPYLDEQVIAVVRIDLTRLDLDKVAARLIDVAKLEARDVDPITGELRGWLPALSKAGAKEMYLVASLADVPFEPLVAVVPLPAGADARSISAALDKSKQFRKVEQIGQTVVAGGERALKRVRDLKPTARPELARAFAGAGEATIHLLFLPTADLRRAFDEMLPTLPRELGGGPSKVFTRGITWAAVGIDLTPKLELRMAVQSPDADGARALGDAVVAVLKGIKDQKEVRAVFPKFEELLPLFTPKVAENRLTLTLEEKDLTAVVVPLLVQARSAVLRTQGMDSLRQLALAMHNHADSRKGRFPATAIFDKKGKPLLSWRVHLLPFLGEDNLYKQFRLDEPWDSEHNKKLIAQMPKVFQGPNQKLNAEGKTVYLVPVGEATAFTGRPQGVRMPLDFPDGTSNTIILVEADDNHAVVWTRPEDLKFNPEQPHAGLGGRPEGGFLVALGDGTVRPVAKTISKQTLQSAFIRNDGRVLGPDW